MWQKKTFLTFTHILTRICSRMLALWRPAVLKERSAATLAGWGGLTQSTVKKGSDFDWLYFSRYWAIKIWPILIPRLGTSIVINFHSCVIVAFKCIHLVLKLDFLDCISSSHRHLKQHAHTNAAQVDGRMDDFWKTFFLSTKSNLKPDPPYYRSHVNPDLNIIFILNPHPNHNRNQSEK